MEFLRVFFICLSVLVGGIVFFFLFCMLFPFGGDIVMEAAVIAYILIVMVVCTYMILKRIHALSEQLKGQE